MSRVYDLWDKLVGAVLDREELRRLALRSCSSSNCSSFSDYSSRFSFVMMRAWVQEIYCPLRDILPTSTLKVYSFGDLKCATRNFRRDMVLGIGDFGSVYMGWVDEKSLQPSKQGTGMMVAIKKLNPQSMQDFDEWQSEVDFFGRLTHPNLVKLLGYCWEDKEMLLVYEFMQKGSLENHLFRRNASAEPLPWDTRLKIAIGVAKGLAFLNASDSNYRDFKASNILLDGNFNAKISDLWLVKLEPSGGNATLQMAIGAANEMAFLNASYSIYQRTGHLNKKCNVYGFGVVLLELLTGSRGLDILRAYKNLVYSMIPLPSQIRKLMCIMDERLQGQYLSKAAAWAAQLTLRCLEQEPRNRPSMEEVAEVLERIAAMVKPKVSKSSRSTHSASSSLHHK